MTDLPVLILIAVYTETNRKVLIKLLLKSLELNAKKLLVALETILREKSLAIYFEDSQFRRNMTLNFIVSLIYVDKRSRVR